MKLELEIDNIDYDTLIERYLPILEEGLKKSGHPAARLLGGGMSGSMVKMFLRSLSKEKKDKLLADLFNSNKAAVIRYVQETLEKQGIQAEIVRALASE